jgi:hypothetical protein
MFSELFNSEVDSLMWIRGLSVEKINEMFVNCQVSLFACVNKTSCHDSRNWYPIHYYNTVLPAIFFACLLNPALPDICPFKDFFSVQNLQEPKPCLDRQPQVIILGLFLLFQITRMYDINFYTASLRHC